jgi:hypothetical protein
VTVLKVDSDLFPIIFQFTVRVLGTLLVNYLIKVHHVNCFSFVSNQID